MLAKKPLEGAYNVVGDDENPQLQAAELDDHEEVQVGEHSFTREEVEIAHDALEKVREVGVVVGRVVTPFNVVLASVFMAFLLFTSFALVFWVLPRDAVSVETVYMQSGPGHVVMIEIHNYGTREISEVTVTVEFIDSQGETLNSTRFYRDSIPSHTSIAGDDLELVMGGATVWAQYDIVITLEYTYYGGEEINEEWTHTVGDWTSEFFTDKAERHYL